MKIKKNQYIVIHDLYVKDRQTLAEIAKQYNVTLGRISQIVNAVRKQEQVGTTDQQGVIASAS